jgi:histidinol-phosphate aminotransferase
MTDWSGLAVTAAPEDDPFDIGGAAAVRARHGLDDVVKLHWNENPFGPLPGVLDAVRDELANAWMYPEDAYEAFRDDAASAIGTSPGRIFPGHGTQTLIGMLATALVRPGDRVVVPALTYYLYGRASAVRGAVVHHVPMRDLHVDVEAVVDTARRVDAKIAWLCDPNNPTGAVLDRAEWDFLLDELPGSCALVVDEAYVDFLPAGAQTPRLPAIDAGRPVVVLRSFSKFFGLAGLRLGYAIADEELPRYLALLEEPYNVSCAAIAAGRACLRAGAAADERRREIDDARRVLADGLREAGAEPLPSVANFVLARVGVDDALLADGLAREGILIRPGTDLGLPGYVRITVAPEPVMRRVTTRLGEVRASLSS